MAKVIKSLYMPYEESACSVLLNRRIRKVLGGSLLGATLSLSSLINIVNADEPSPPVTLPPVDVYPTPGGGWGGRGGLGGGGIWGGGGWDTECHTCSPHIYIPPDEPDPNPELSAECKKIQGEMVAAKCDFNSIPQLTVNGCGSELSAILIPDSFLGAQTLGAIFTPACNQHDVCYGTLDAIKAECDNQLGDSMRHACRQYFSPDRPLPPDERQRLGELLAQCNTQAQAYVTGLVITPTIREASEIAFRSGKQGAQCRELHRRKRDNGCNF